MPRSTLMLSRDSRAVLEGVGEEKARSGRRRTTVVLANCMVMVGKYEEVERFWSLFAGLVLIVCRGDEE